MASTIPFDPFRAQARLLWHNRVARWRANAAETAFHGAALTVLAGFLAWQVTRLDIASRLRDVVQQWPMSVAALLFAALLLRQARIASDEAALARSSWLALQPLPATMLRRRAWRRHAIEAMLQLAVVLVAVVASGIDSRAMAVASLLVMLAAVLAPTLPLRGARIATTNLRQRSAVPDAGVGRLWRWQKIETGIAFRARTLAGGIFLLLLVPMGSGPIVVGVMLVCGLVTAWLLGAWRCSLGVVVSAQAWLAPQPLRARDLLRGTVAVPAVVLGIAMACVVVLFVALGTPRLAVFASLALFALGTLQAACVAASRRAPRRIPILFVLHLVLLLACVQAMPPLVLPMWLLQTGWLLRKALKP